MRAEKRIYEKAQLVELLKDKHSCLILKSCTRRIELQPKYVKDVRVGIKEALDQCLNRYDYSLNGILLDYQNLCVIPDNNSGKIIGKCGEFVVSIKGEFFVFQPEIGNHVKGVVNVKSDSHVGCLVHKCFNAMILKPENIETENWNCKNIRIGDEIVFEIADHVFSGHVPFIEGKISGEYLEKKLRKKLKKSRRNTSLAEHSQHNGHCSTENEYLKNDEKAVDEIDESNFFNYSFETKTGNVEESQNISPKKKKSGSKIEKEMDMEPYDHGSKKKKRKKDKDKDKDKDKEKDRDRDKDKDKDKCENEEEKENENEHKSKEKQKENKREKEIESVREREKRREEEEESRSEIKHKQKESTKKKSEKSKSFTAEKDEIDAYTLESSQTKNKKSKSKSGNQTSFDTCWKSELYSSTMSSNVAGKGNVKEFDSEPTAKEAAVCAPDTPTRKRAGEKPKKPPAKKPKLETDDRLKQRLILDMLQSKLTRGEDEFDKPVTTSTPKSVDNISQSTDKKDTSEISTPKPDFESSTNKDKKRKKSSKSKSELSAHKSENEEERKSMINALLDSVKLSLGINDVPKQKSDKSGTKKDAEDPIMQWLRKSMDKSSQQVQKSSKGDTSRLSSADSGFNSAADKFRV